MNQEYRYTLEKGSKKHLCPDCNKKTFVRFTDSETGEYLPEQYGRCDRESNCAYYLNPYADGYAKAISESNSAHQANRKDQWQPRPKAAQKKAIERPVFIPVEVLKQTLQAERYQCNTFIQNLLERIPFPFTIADIERVVSLYYLGTIANGYRSGAITFPFIDAMGNIRAVQAKQFDKDNHTTATDFLHSIIEKHLTKSGKAVPEWLQAYQSQEKRVSCLFGEHLLPKYPKNAIALVEAPKTAIYCTLYFGFPDNEQNPIWLAVYNKSSFTFDKLKALQGRTVFIFPDLSKDGSTFSEWQAKAKAFEGQLTGTRFIVSDLLEQIAPQQDRENGNDIADYLIKQDWRPFRNKWCNKQPMPEPPPPTKTETIIQPFVEVQPLEPFTWTPPEQPTDWSGEIAELETYFTSTTLPTEPVKLNQCSTITNVPLFVQSHLDTLRINNGKETFIPYLKRLQDFKESLTQIQN